MTLKERLSILAQKASNVLVVVTGVSVTIKKKVVQAATVAAGKVDEKIIKPLAPHVNVEKFGPLFRILGMAMASCLVILAAYYAYFGVKMLFVGFLSMLTLHLVSAGACFVSAILFLFTSLFIGMIGLWVFELLGEHRPKEMFNIVLAYVGYQFNRVVNSAQ